MNVLSKVSNINVATIVKDQKVGLTVDKSSSLAIQNLVLMESSCYGLCSNCENNTQCAWQRENKIFCEHYQ